MNTEFILVLDVGNTRVKWACLTPGGLQDFGDAPLGGADLTSLVTAACARHGRPARVVTCNVAGEECAARLRAATEKHWGLRPEFVAPVRSACGVVNGYREPERLGADRWAALIAARHLNLGAAYIVDCGTAVTVDALDAAGAHLGGIILPGLALMRAALNTRTRGINYAAPHDNTLDITPLARDTANAVASGTLYAVAAAIDRAATDIGNTLPDAVRIITGGDAERVRPLLAGAWRHEPHLVLQGLAVIARDTS